MDRWVGKVCVVTGASSGIGEAIAKGLVQEGMIVVGLARRKDRLESIQKSLAGEKGTFHPYECDVSDERRVLEAFKWIKETLGTVHALVNNAGIMHHGEIIDSPSTALTKIFEVNVFGLLYCSREAVRLMKEADFEGTIINMNSITGHKVLVIPNLAYNVYPGTKHAMTAISEILQHELRDNKLRIRVTNLSPGTVESEMVAAIVGDSTDLPMLKGEDIASSVKYILSAPQRVQITELTIRPLGETF